VLCKGRRSVTSESCVVGVGLQRSDTVLVEITVYVLQVGKKSISL